jgi:hypothetical protein
MGPNPRRIIYTHSTVVERYIVFEFKKAAKYRMIEKIPEIMQKPLNS